MDQTNKKTCPRCKRVGKRIYKGYCSKAHYILNKRRTKKVVLPCAYCGDYVKRNPSQVSKSGNVYCKKCKKPRGENHVRWKGGIYNRPDGYRLISTDKGWKREHVVVWEEANKACVLPWAQAHIHHLDENKLNNSADNLLLLSSEEHGRIHQLFKTDPTKAFEILIGRAYEQAHFPSEISKISFS